jgi:hypothetical protein
MAKEKIVTERFTSDISGEEATQTIQYAVNGMRYEIDVAEVEAKEFHEALAPYISVSRVRGQRSGGNGAERKARTEETQRIRAWAAEQGIVLTTTGRIPNEVREQYAASQRANAKPARKRPARRAEKKTK